MVEVAVGLGLDREGDVGQLDDVFMASVMTELAVGRPDRHGESWAVLAGEHDRIKGWVDTKVPVVKMGELLARRSVVVPERTLHRYVAEHFGSSSADGSTVPLADCAPGAELQVDWAKLGFIVDTATSRRRSVWALVFTSVFSRHCFVWLSHSQALDAVIAGFDAAWEFFGGVFTVVIPDNMATI
ncbi:MAG: IS21 family transposase, partial [Acidimicrobiales bacterium]